MTTPSTLDTAKTELAPSGIRTILPFIIGAVVAKLTDLGVELDANTQAVMTVVFGSVWYMVVRALEVFASDKWGYVLGFKKKPVYTEPAPVAQVTESPVMDDTYQRVPAAEFPDGDNADSTAVEDRGAPE